MDIINTPKQTKGAGPNPSARELSSHPPPAATAPLSAPLLIAIVLSASLLAGTDAQPHRTPAPSAECACARGGQRPQANLADQARSSGESSSIGVLTRCATQQKWNPPPHHALPDHCAQCNPTEMLDAVASTFSAAAFSNSEKISFLFVEPSPPLPGAQRTFWRSDSVGHALQGQSGARALDRRRHRSRRSRG